MGIPVATVRSGAVKLRKPAALLLLACLTSIYGTAMAGADDPPCGMLRQESCERQCDATENACSQECAVLCRPPGGECKDCQSRCRVARDTCWHACAEQRRSECHR